MTVSRAILIILVIAVLASCAGGVRAQQPNPQFESLASRATEARNQQNIPLAIELYGKAVEANPDWAEGWFYTGLLQYSSNGFPAAIDAFNHFLRLQPDVAPALALRGLSEFETGAYDDALRDLELGVKKGAADEPRNEQVIRFHLAELLARTGRFEEAVAQYDFFVAHRVRDSDLLVALGLAGIRRQELPRDIPQQNRPLLEAVGSAGYAYLSGDYEEASKQFNALFAHYPAMPNLHFFYGSLLYTDNPTLAIDQFRAEVAHVPGNMYAHGLLAFTLTIQGRYAEAKPEAEIALAADPGMEMAQVALGRALAETGDVKRTTEVLNKVLQKDPQNLEAHMGLADVYSRAGRREEAYRERMVCLGLAR